MVRFSAYQHPPEAGAVARRLNDNTPPWGQEIAARRDFDPAMTASGHKQTPRHHLG
jgi:hypothetical protein